MSVFSKLTVSNFSTLIFRSMPSGSYRNRGHKGVVVGKRNKRRADRRAEEGNVALHSGWSKPGSGSEESTDDSDAGSSHTDEIDDGGVGCEVEINCRLGET